MFYVNARLHAFLLGVVSENKKLANVYGQNNDSVYCPVRLAVRTQDFHSCNRGSIPLRDAILIFGLYLFTK